jgi:hypothetical protein
LFNVAYAYSLGATGNPQTFTIELWFKTNTSSGLITANDGGGLYGATDRGMYVGTTGFLYFNVFPGFNITINGTANCLDNHWHHAVGTLNQSTTAMILYLDGQPVASTTGASAQTGYTCEWLIGAFKPGSRPAAPPNNGEMVGYLSRPAVYSTALSGADVYDHFVGGLGSLFSVRDPLMTRVPGIN